MDSKNTLIISFALALAHAPLLQGMNPENMRAGFGSGIDLKKLIIQACEWVKNYQQRQANQTLLRVAWNEVRTPQDMVMCIKACQQALNNGANVNIKAQDGSTPLFWACYRNNIDLVTFLLEKGADVNAVDKGQWTPLHAACCNTNCRNTRLSPEIAYTIIKLLVARGANVNAVINNKYRDDYHGYTPLMWCSQNNHLEAMHFLINKGAEVTVSLSLGLHIGYTPLTWACRNRNIKALKLLLTHGALVQLVDFDQTADQTINNFLRMVYCWQQRANGKLMEFQTTLQRTSDLQNHATWVIPLLLSPVTGKTILNALASYDQLQATQLLPAIMTAFFASTRNNTLYDEQRMATVALDITKQYLNKQDWDNCLERASKEFKEIVQKKLQGHWIGHKKATQGLQHALVNEQKCDTSFLFN